MATFETAVVTGASRGIGAATAILLARNGYRVAVHYGSNEKLAQGVVDTIRSSGGNAVAVQADMGVEKDILRLFDTVQKEFGTLTALVNNAAVNLRDGDGSVEQLSRASAEKMMAVNVIGVISACREALWRMKDRGGAIVNVSSEAARFGGNRISAYAASKAAVAAFTVGFAREAAACNVRVNAVSPAIIVTDAHPGADAERLKALKASIPLGRLGEPAEVAEAIAWLLSDRASYISGAVLPISGAR